MNLKVFPIRIEFRMRQFIVRKKNKTKSKLLLTEKLMLKEKINRTHRRIENRTQFQNRFWRNLGKKVKPAYEKT